MGSFCTDYFFILKCLRNLLTVSKRQLKHGERPLQTVGIHFSGTLLLGGWWAFNFPAIL